MYEINITQEYSIKFKIKVNSRKGYNIKIFLIEIVLHMFTV
jgi:hypothetical protein